MNSPKGMLDPNKEITQRTKKYDSKIEAEKVAYKTDKGELYVPAEAVKGCLVNASAYKKFGKYVARPIIAGGVFILPDKILLGTKKYEIDLRTVVIQRARIVKARPKISKWKIQFDLMYDDTLISSGDLIKPILMEGGRRVGILDFRPQKLGSFGMFEVSKWEESK